MRLFIFCYSDVIWYFMFFEVTSVVVPLLLLWFLIVTCSCCPYLYFDSYILIKIRQLIDHLSGNELFIRFTARAFRKLLSIYVHVFLSLLVLRAGYGIWSAFRVGV